MKKCRAGRDSETHNWGDGGEGGGETHRRGIGERHASCFPFPTTLYCGLLHPPPVVRSFVLSSPCCMFVFPAPQIFFIFYFCFSFFGFHFLFFVSCFSFFVFPSSFFIFRSSFFYFSVFIFCLHFLFFRVWHSSAKLKILDRFPRVHPGRTQKVAYDGTPHVEVNQAIISLVV